MDDLFQHLTGPDAFRRVVEANSPVDHRGRYLHWEDMRVRKPPSGISLEEWWLGTKMARSASERTLPFKSVNGEFFKFSNIDLIQEAVHRIDQQASGRILADDVAINLRSSDRYLVSSIVEEAITSSQLEGASTTRRVAKEMLASGRKPRDRSETMIVNNFQAMLFSQSIHEQALSSDEVLELHRILTEGTLENPEAAGRLQAPEDKRVGVYWGQEELLLHQPPKAQELPVRLDNLCRFANGELDTRFIHPVVKAIIVHFCLAYDHPFEDGNGRTARALFYWSLLHDGYWLAQYISISSILNKAPAKYAMSYLYTESDDYDLTYFIVYQLGVIERAITSLYKYLARKIAETRQVEALIHDSSNLNHRQIAVLQHALRDPGESFTIAAHRRMHRVTYETARSDLLRLEDMELLVKSRAGKTFVFRSPKNLEDRLRSLTAH